MYRDIPSSEYQVQFLRNIQRLLAEGLFVASYKFALIHALADLAVIKGDDTGAPLVIHTSEIAENFVELYWRQSRPFHAKSLDPGLILQQNTGGQASIISRISISQQECGGSLFRLQQTTPRRWKSLVSEIDKVVRTMPLWKLQTVGDERIDFLYENLDQGTQITLKPGVAYCFRAFYELIRDLIEAAWIRFVQKLNAPRLGSQNDLGTFLFGVDRASLETYRPIMYGVQRGICLYCRKKLSGKTQVDHFVPWSRYPVDVGHNLVLAHDRCNLAKSDFIAAEEHLSSWYMRNHEHQAELQDRLVEAGLPCDLASSIQIAKWIYSHIEKANGQVWVEGKVLRHLSPDWSRCFAA